MSEWFSADDFGECANCGEEYAPGEMVYEVEDGLIGECCGYASSAAFE